MRFFSPAKINLYFQVLRKREDGYHDISSIFQAITLGDHLDIALAENDSFSCTDPKIPTDASNLIHKAIQLFRKKTGLSFSAKIHLEKNIPIEAGLGGGSSNAATTLWAINSLLGSPVSEKELTQWGGEIGSDVAFFFSTGTALCKGRGEIIENKALKDPLSLYIAKPSFGLSTPAVFKSVDYSKLTKEDPDTLAFRFLSGNNLYFNDLEHAAYAAEPKLRKFKEELLEAGFSQVVMTGSGSSYFCFGEPKNPLASTKLVKVNSLQRNQLNWYIK
jgi:4-diphosphocytidyl-2-C-methyl-D-erythritol kinase